MQINLTLYTTKLSPTDTLYFASKQAQENYFNSLPSVGYYPNLSYPGGTRNIRLKGTVPYLLTTSPANYARIEYLSEDRATVQAVHYCFIDNIVYVNDNCYDIELTIDYIQTFLFSPIEVFGDFAIVAENRNFKTQLRRSYGNTMPVAIMREDVIYSARQKYENFEFVYAVLTIKSQDNDQFNPSMNTGLASYVFPAIILKSASGGQSTREPSFITILGDIYTRGNSGGWEFRDAKAFLNSDEVKGNFVGLTYVDDICLRDRFTFSTEAPPDTWNNAQAIWIKINEADPILSSVYLPQAMADAFRNSLSGLTYITNNISNKDNRLPFFFATPERVITTGGLAYDHILRREPYSWVEFRIRGQQAQRVSFIDNNNYYDSTVGSSPALELRYSFNPLYPNTTTYYLPRGASVNEVFSVAPAVSNLAFSIDQWAQYYISHQASVNDGLATKHSYDMEVANRNLATQVATTSLTTALGVGMGLASGNAEQAVGSIVQGGTKLVGSIVAYQNTKTNLQKEKALLELSYQDLKSAPASVNNQELNQNSFASILDGGFKIVLISPNYSEYNTIMRYHTIYGFRLEEYTNTQAKFNSSSVSLATFLKPDNDPALNGYKYICAQDVKLQNGLAVICQIITSILENGLKVWSTPENLNTSNYPYETGYTPANTPLSQMQLTRI